MFLIRSNMNLPSQLQHFVPPDAEGEGFPGITQNTRSKGTSFRKFRGELLKGTGRI